MAENNRPHRKRTFLLLGILVLAALLGTLMLKKYYYRRPLQKPAPPVAINEGVRSVILFFASPDGAGLVKESREIRPCEDTASCSEAVLEELINGPLGDFSPTLPETSTFHGVTLQGDLLTVDFGQEFQDGLASGSNAEMMAVFSVVNSLIINFPQARKVRLIVDGKVVDTLKGHLDLREPFLPDFALEKKELPPAVEQKPVRSN